MFSFVGPGSVCGICDWSEPHLAGPGPVWAIPDWSESLKSVEQVFVWDFPELCTRFSVVLPKFHTIYTFLHHVFL